MDGDRQAPLAFAIDRQLGQLLGSLVLVARALTDVDLRLFGEIRAGASHVGRRDVV
jgi:hypothetical protein